MDRYPTEASLSTPLPLYLFPPLPPFPPSLPPTPSFLLNFNLPSSCTSTPLLPLPWCLSLCLSSASISLVYCSVSLSLSLSLPGLESLWDVVSFHHQHVNNCQFSTGYQHNAPQRHIEQYKENLMQTVAKATKINTNNDDEEKMLSNSQQSNDKKASQ